MQDGDRQSARSSSKRRLFIALYLAGLALLALGTGELWARHWAHIPNFKDERRLFYEYDRELGWLPRKDSESRAEMSQPFTVRHNSQHFRDREHPPSGKPALCVLGDSFVWGFDVEAEARFTDLLQARLPQLEVFNMGVSGYSTDQELLVLQRYFDAFRPQLVLLHFACDVDGDDRKGNMSNKAYRYFKPHFALKDGALELQGVPVPKNASYRIEAVPAWLKGSFLARYLASRMPEPAQTKGEDPTHAILAEMQRWLAQRGAKLVLAKNAADPLLEDFCRAQAIPLIDLAFIGDEHKFQSYGRHWTESGNALAADALYAGLAEHLPAPANGATDGR